MRHRRKASDQRPVDRTEDFWFAQKRYGYGATPIRWQGWALVTAYIAAMLGIGSSGLPVTALLVLMIAVTIAFTVITLQKTQGRWRWRWGSRD